MKRRGEERSDVELILGRGIVLAMAHFPSSFWDELEKIGAMAGDLRMKTPGIKMINPPTEDSKQFAFKQLRNSAKPGKFLNKTEPKHLIGPGPSIKQTATLPTG